VGQRHLEDASNDIMVDRLAVSGVHLPRSVTGSTSQVDGIALRHGERMTCATAWSRVCAAARSATASTGTRPRASRTNHVWTFDRGNVAHNNEGSGLRFWNNILGAARDVDVVTYRNGIGVENGAYANANFFEGMLLVDDVLFAQASGRALDGRPQTFRNVSAPELRIGHVRLEARAWQQYERLHLRPRGRRWNPAAALARALRAAAT
jgi:hypothetical protein